MLKSAVPLTRASRKVLLPRRLATARSNLVVPQSREPILVRSAETKVTSLASGFRVASQASQLRTATVSVPGGGQPAGGRVHRRRKPVRDGREQRSGPLPRAHGLQGHQEARPASPGAGDGADGRPPERVHVPGTHNLLRQMLGHRLGKRCVAFFHSNSLSNL